MKRPLLLSLCILAVSYAPIVEAQSPAVCEGVYLGTYAGDFIGDVSAVFSLPDDDVACASPPLGVFRANFFGSVAQFFYEDVTRTEVLSALCFFEDLSFEDSGTFTGSVAEGHIRQFSVSGTLNLITCTVSGVWSLERTDFVPPFGTTLEGSGTFIMSLDPAREGVIWTATNGDFNDPNNWQQQAIPGADQDARFIQNLSYAVSFGTPASSGGFVVEQGFVTFLTGNYQATGGSESVPSALVGTTAGNNAFLTLSFHNLTTAFSTFAPGAGHRGGVDVQDGSIWTEQTRMVIGGAGSGSLDIADTGAVIASETQLGAEASGEGEVELSSNDARWTTGSIAVGLRGKGTVNHRAGSVQSHVVSIAVEPNSHGEVNVGSAGNDAIWGFEGDMIVGQGGIGRLNIVEGGYVVSTTTDITLVFVGLTAGSGIGNLRVEGASSTLDVPNSIISPGGSSNGSGFITVKNGGEIKCRSALIDQHASLRIENAGLTYEIAIVVGNLGTIALVNGSIDSDFLGAELAVESGGTISGTGYIYASTSTIEGTVAPSVIISTSKGLSGQTGGLTFGGNVNFGSATLEIQVGGLAEGNYSVIHATGAIDIQNSTVVFRFIEGFLPRTGDIVPFLVADGGVTIANLALEFEGVADGFQFEVTEENGMLVFEALTDAEPDPNACHGADLNRDGRINFLDLLNFIGQMNAQ